MSELASTLITMWGCGAGALLFMYLTCGDNLEPRWFAILALWPLMLILLSPILLIFVLKYVGEALSWVVDVYSEVIAR